MACLTQLSRNRAASCFSASAPQASFTFYWGDGSASDYNGPWSGPPGFYGFSVFHTYAVPGQYMVTIDNDGDGTFIYLPTAVLEPNNTPTLTGETALATPGQPVTLTADFDGVNPNVPNVAYIDGQLAAISYNGPSSTAPGMDQGTISVQLPAAPAPGSYAFMADLYDATNPYITNSDDPPQPAASGLVGLEVWGRPSTATRPTSPRTTRSWSPAPMASTTCKH